MTSNAGSALDTFPKLVAANAERLPRNVAIREKDLGIWQSYTWRDYLERSRRIALGLASLGFARGDKTAIIGDNRPELYWAILATQALGGVPVPLYQDSIEKELTYIVGHAEVRFAVAEDQEQVDKLLRVREQCPKLEFIVYADLRGLRAYSEPGLLSLAELEERGEKFALGHARYFEDEVTRGGGEDTAVICYTSGTTGSPKGAMLSYRNLIEMARSAIEREGLRARRRGARVPADGLGRRPHVLLRARRSWPASRSTARRAPTRSCTTSRRSGRPTSSRRRGSGRTCSPAS